MRRRLLRACNGCGRTTTTSPCPNCRPTTTSSYASAEYQAARAQCLNEEKTCWICGKPGTKTDPLTADHIRPRAAGGTDERSNLHAAHRTCNGSRQASRGSVFSHDNTSRIPRNSSREKACGVNL